MELAGDEKNIRALFSDLKLEDVSCAPAFAAVWIRAQMSREKPRQEFGLSFALVSVLLTIVLFSLTLWIRNRQLLNPSLADGSKYTESGVTATSSRPVRQETIAKAPRIRVRPRRTSCRAVKVRQSELTAMNLDVRESWVISIWQSPTATLMQSPADDVLTSLPQMDRPVTELQSFLPSAPQ